MPINAPGELASQEPLASLYRAREHLSDPHLLEMLDAIIVLIVKRAIKAKLR